MWSFRRMLASMIPSRPDKRSRATGRAQGHRAVEIWRPGYLDPHAFLGAVKRLLAQTGPLHPRLHVFSLSDFHRAAGRKWGRIADMVAMVSDTVIRRHLDPRADIFTRIDEETALLALPLASRSEAHARVAAIARDLAGQLFGDCVLDGRRPEVTATNMPLEAAVAADGALDEGAVRRALEEARPLAGDIADDGPAPRLEHPARAALADLMTDEPAWAELRHARDTHRQGRPLRSDAVLSLVWRPTWVASRSALGAFMARVIRRDGEDAVPLEGSAAYAGTEPMGALTIDRFVATQATRQLRSASIAGRGGRLVVPVAWTSLDPSWRDCLLTPLSDSPAAARQRRLCVELVGVPPDLSAGEVSPIVQTLSELGAAVLLRLPLGVPDPAAIPAGVAAVGVDLGELAEDDRRGDEVIFRRLEIFRRAAGRPCYVWGVRRRMLVARLAKSGFVMVNGSGLAHDCAIPA